jgi:hypothetical protein
MWCKGIGLYEEVAIVRSTMKQVIIGLVIGVIGFRLFNNWLAAVPSSSEDRHQRTYVDQLTNDDIEADVGVSEKLAAFLKDDTTIIGGYGSLEIEQVGHE